MSIQQYCVSHNDEGTDLRLLSPLNKTSLAVNDMTRSPFGKMVWSVRNLGFNPAYDAPVTTVTATTTGATGSGAAAAAAAAAGADLNNNTKIDRIACTPDLSLVAVASERIIRLVSGETKAVVAELWMDDRVLALHMNSDLLCVVLARATHFFHVDTLQPLPELRTQWPTPNYTGLGALSKMHDSGTCYFATSQSLSDKKDRGDVFLYDPWRAATLTVFDAHKDEPIRCIEFSGSGTRLATCTTKGKHVRIWSCPDCTPLYELQRGQTEAVIYSIGLNYDATALALTSNTGTLHLFQPGKNARSVNKITTRTSATLCFMSPDGQFLFVLYPPDANNKTAKLERYKLSHDLKGELENEMNLS